MNYWLHPEAQDDLREAAEFYREKGGTALSQSLLQEFEHSVSLLLEHPGLERDLALWQTPSRDEALSLRADLQCRR